MLGPRLGAVRHPALLLWLALVTWLALATSATAATTVTLTGSERTGPITPGADGSFAFPDVPLRKNAVDTFTVTATDDTGRSLSREVRITQLSLESVVVSRVTATPLTVQQVQQLVTDGVIRLDDPENFNVSQFNIVLTIGREAVPISLPIAVPKAEDAVGFEVIKLPRGRDGTGGDTPRVVDVIVFELPVPAAAAAVGGGPRRIPGVIIVEGRIKSLKEFFSVRLLLMNTSGIFTLRDVKAMVEFPGGGLSATLPADGIGTLGDILPGNATEPGQAEREFIIRGDAIGIRPVRVSFGGLVAGPGIPDDAMIPFNGSADTTVEVKGPPTFQVQVTHPPAVVAGVPYELVVSIANTGETPALYASLALDVGAAAELVDCTVDAGVPACEPLQGSATRSFGHIFPGVTVSETFTVLPQDTGPITSCLGVADQNISLQVHVGNLGCLVGQFPPVTGVPAGVPTVRVVPTPNIIGVGIDSPVVAFFSKAMNTSTITLGETGSFRVLDDLGRVAPGRLRFETLGDKTAAIWQLEDGITNRLAPDTEYAVALTQDIRDLQGNALASKWSSRFTTTNPASDQDPPALSLSIEPPVDPRNVLPGQIVRINALASDQGSGVARVELRRQDADTPGAPFELVDQKTVFETSSGPCIFSVDSAKLAPGRTYQFKATAFDKAGNRQDATIPVILAAAATVPTIRMPADPVQPVPKGISVTLSPVEVSASVKTVHYYLDGGGAPVRTITLAPFTTILSTLDLALGPHTIRAVAVDGLGQSGEDDWAFVVAANGTRPEVSFGAAVDGAVYTVGQVFLVTATASDPVGIASVVLYLDSVGGAPIATGTQPFTVDTAGIGIGPHRIIAVATNRLGVTNDLAAPGSILDFTVAAAGSGPAPAAPTLAALAPPQNGSVTVQGSTVPGARLDITNVTQGLAISVYATTTGAFTAMIAANAGDLIRVVAVDLARSPTPSAPTQSTVPAPPALTRIEVSPAQATLTAANAVVDLTVTAFYGNGTSADVTTQAAFSSSAPRVAAVNTAGRVVALSTGQAAITAQVGAHQAQAAISVAIRTLIGIAVDPSSFTLAGVGRTRQLAVIGTYSDGTSGPITSGVTFSTSAPAIALVSTGGLVTATGLGSATITAAVAGVPSAQSLVQVTAVAPVSIGVSPSAVLFTAAGESRQLLVSRTLSDGSVEPAPAPITYESSAPTVATVDATGLVRAVDTGDATITVGHLGLEATVAVTVDIPVVVAPPEIAALDRPRAGEGDLFVIRGRNFAAVPAQNQVRVNGLAAAVQSARQDELTVLVPAGAATGPVTVKAGSFTSNAVTLGIYPRRARGLELTGAVDLPAAPGETLVLTLSGIDVRAGDVALLSSAPDVPAPLAFGGTLGAKVDAGATVPITPSATDVVDVTSLFTPGVHTLTLTLTESGGRVRTGPIHLLVGPDDTGPIAGDRFVVALGQSRLIPVTVTDLPYPDGSKVAVTVLQIGVADPTNTFPVSSAGGSIANGLGASPNDNGRFVYFTVTGGRIDVLYDPAGVQLATGDGAVANVQVLPADAAGSRIGFQAVVVEPVALTTFDTAAAARTQSAVIADGRPKTVTVAITGIRDSQGNRVPDGTRIAVTTQQIGVADPTNTFPVPSAGGSIVNGLGASPNDNGRFVYFTVQGGRVDIQYDPGNVLLGVGDVQTANIQLLPAAADGSRIGFRAFAVVPVALSSPGASPANIAVLPASALSDGADNRVVITVSGVSDAVGNPVPDGTRVAVTTLQIGVADPTNTFPVSSAGGSIVNGAGVSPNDNGRFVYLPVNGGQVQIVYSTAGAAVLSARQTATARVQVLPAAADGSRIGFRAFAVADVALTGYQTAEGSASPASAIADGLAKIVTVSLTGIRDTAGNLVPDGSKVAVTALQIGVADPTNTFEVPSAGGRIVNGLGASPNDNERFVYFTVAGGRVEVQYSPGDVLLGAGDVATANVQALPAAPDGSVIGFRAFAVVPVLLSSAAVPAANVGVSPASVLADGADNRATVTVTGITDALGRPVPGGTRVAVTPLQIGVADPTNTFQVPSAGGTIANGLGASPNDNGRFVYREVQGGQVQIAYSAAGAVELAARETATASVQILPAAADGSRIGFRAFAVGAVTLAGYQSATISGPGAVVPGAMATYTVTDIRDTSGNLVPNGSRIAVTALDIGVSSPDNTSSIQSLGGGIVNGLAASPNDNARFVYFTVQNGQISIQIQAPAGTGTSTLQLLPARPDGSRLGFRAFAVKAIAVGP